MAEKKSFACIAGSKLRCDESLFAARSQLRGEQSFLISTKATRMLLFRQSADHRLFRHL